MDLRKEIRLALGKLMTESDGDKITFDDVPDMYAVEAFYDYAQTDYSNPIAPSIRYIKNRNGWKIYSKTYNDNFSEKIGHLVATGYLIIPRKLASGRMSISNTGMHFGDNLHNAMRYLYLKSNDTKIVSEVEGDRYDFSDVGGYFVVERKTQYYVKGKIRKYWTINDKQGRQLGNVSYDGNLAYFDEHKVAQYPTDITFKTDESGLKQAARYIYLRMAHKKKTLEENRTMFPDIEGWVAKRSETEPKIIWIYNKNGQVKGAIVDKFDQPVLRFGETGRNRYGNPIWGKKIPWDFNDVENAVRYVYMKNQEIQEVVSEEKLDWGRRIRSTYIKGLQGWKAVMERESVIDFYDASGKGVGYLDNGNILHYGKSEGWRGFPESTNWDFEDVDNAARFLWMKSQERKNINESKKEKHILKGQKIVFPDIGNFYAEGMLTQQQIDYAKSKDTDGFIYAELYGPNDEYLGWLNTAGVIDISAQLTASRHQERSKIIFPVNVEGVKNALRYLYLNTHSGSEPLVKKISENVTDEVKPECDRVVRFDDIPGISAYYQCDRGGKWIQWVIYTGAKSPFSGHIVGMMPVESTTSENPETGHLLWRPTKNSDYESVGDFKGNVKNAMRWIWLKMQEKDDTRFKSGRYSDEMVTD